MKKSKHQRYFHCFIICIPGPYAFWFSFQQNIVTILITAVFRTAALIRGEALISMCIPKGVALIRGRRLFEARRLLEEIRYTYIYYIIYIYIYVCMCLSKYSHSNIYLTIHFSFYLKVSIKEIKILSLASGFILIWQSLAMKQIKTRSFTLYEVRIFINYHYQAPFHIFHETLPVIQFV